MCIIGFFIYNWYKRYISDTLVFIDPSNRFEIVKDKITSKTTYNYKNKKYFLTDKSSLLNRKGRSLYIFSQNKPAPMQVSYNNASWISSETLLTMINNDLIRQFAKTKGSIEDAILMLGAIGGMIAGIASVIILLKTFGVI
jgi:hypothetical protein